MLHERGRNGDEGEGVEWGAEVVAVRGGRLCLHLRLLVSETEE